MVKYRILAVLLLMQSCAGDKQGDTLGTTASNPDSTHIIRIESSLYPVFVLEGESPAKTIEEMMEASGVPGLGIAFVDNGQLAWSQSYGYADLKDSIPVTSQTVFRAASLSKPLTAMVSLQLVAEGIIGMEEDISPRLSGWSLPDSPFIREQKVTVANLIGHRSGIGNDTHPGYLENTDMPSNEEILRGQVLDKPLRFIAEPGSQTKYSNVGYMVLSELLSDLTGQPLPYYRYPFEGAGSLMTTPSDLAVFLAAVMEDYRQEQGGAGNPAFHCTAGFCP